MTEVYLHLEGDRNPILIKLSNEKLTIGEIVKQHISTLVGNTHEQHELKVFIEDEDELISLDVEFQQLKLKNRCHVHAHKCHKVDVHIVYNGIEKSLQEPPSSTIKKVKSKALHLFDITKDDGMDLLLRLGSAEGEILQDDEHIGSLVSGPHCHVRLYLTPKKNVQG